MQNDVNKDNNWDDVDEMQQYSDSFFSDLYNDEDS